MISLQILTEVQKLIDKELPGDRGRAVSTYLALAFDKCLDYNSRFVRWDSTRDKIVNTFSSHDFRFKWSFAEFDASERSPLGLRAGMRCLPKYLVILELRP